MSQAGNLSRLFSREWKGVHYFVSRGWLAGCCPQRGTSRFAGGNSILLLTGYASAVVQLGFCALPESSESVLDVVLSHSGSAHGRTVVCSCPLCKSKKHERRRQRLVCMCGKSGISSALGGRVPHQQLISGGGHQQVISV